MQALLPRLRPQADPRAYGLAHYDVAWYLLRADQPAAAAAPLAAARPYLARHGNQSDRVRLRWLEALQLRRLGRASAAVARKMNAAIDGFVRLGRPYSAAVAALELAILHLEQGQTTEVKALAERIYPIFAREGVAREAQATILVFHQAVCQEALTLEVARGLLGKMEGKMG